MAQKRSLDEIFSPMAAQQNRRSLDDIFGQQQSQPQQVKQSLTPVETGRGALADVGVGAGKELLNLGKGASSLGERLFSGALQTILPKSAEKALGVENAPNLGFLGKKRGGETEAEKSFRQFEERRNLQPNQLTTPVNTAQKVGFYGTQVLEALTPMGIEAGVARASLPVRGLIGGALAGTESAIREGELNKNVALSAGLGSVGGAVFGGLSNKLGKAKVAPFANKVDEEVVGATRRLGMKPLSSQVSSSPAVALLEGYTAKGVGGKGLQEQLTRFYDDANRIANELREKGTTKTDLAEIGDDILKRTDKLTRDLIDIKDKAYQQVPLEQLRSATVVPQKTQRIVREIVDSKKQAGAFVTDKKFFESILNDLQQPLSGDVMRSKIQALGQRIKNFQDPIVTGNRGQLRRIYASMAEEFDSALTRQNPVLGGLLKQANETYSVTLQALRSPFVKTTKRLAETPDKLVEAILNEKTSLSLIDNILEALGPENANNVRGALLEKMFNKSRNQEGLFLPGGIQRQINKFGQERLNKIFTPEQVATLNDLSKAVSSLSKVQKIQGGSQTAYLLKVMGQFGLLFSHPFLAISTLLGDGILGKFLSSPTGQEILTTGVNTPNILKPLAGMSQKATTTIPRTIPKLLPTEPNRKD